MNDSNHTQVTGQNGRYSRQVRFTPFGAGGQAGLARANVLIVGTGALGTGIAETLARCGVGRLILADRDYVEWSNLQRQQLYTEEDARLRTPKAEAAKVRLQQINSEIQIEAHVMDVRAEELESLLSRVDLIMDGTDNFDTRLIINDMAQKYGIPWIYGACVGSYGVTYTILPGETPCLNCLLGTVPLGGDTCDTAGILPQAAQLVTANATAEAIKLLGGRREQLRGRLLSFDVWRNEHQEIGVKAAKKADCPSCGSHAVYPYLTAVNTERSDVLCGRDTVQIRPAQRRQLNLQETAARLAKLGTGKVDSNPYLVSFTEDPYRLVIFADGRALIHGTSDIAAARSVYHRYFG
ncbi:MULTISPECIES: ThiF family adenylyltransferase [unclassified Paenibacillus]|uniref:ThiF family adenylyltransferase n=1 Tax=unclassified Paenibacillus TaxID=185978 RepID=UPI00240774FD|nr:MULTISPECIES: ThiF family adenylyltransferase [unclassified Paenibacillus]MDF9841085.1 molybdopterin/thiamine biosynthesis adenylyltransferase [Paenibacillus sp. PastF-2]MDF9847743.1 molybdopterin/thiamine biosynthesis adenylyltransferase [Paenibacillus sp. PastM-2]MDF9854312.1 molybdopterin/thiamine biosynthesis adenylyltransferase [Paenibacillus sp. PastF-1]MDH6479517.1 molybdopterin/thiamine biosynthesis adenylyltransferase [Paenibacillus sp. PastH-2]MDH6505183.1 molybdopterin/thiamine b